MRRRTSVGAVVAALLLVSACSSQEPSALADAERRLAEARSGRIRIELRAEDAGGAAVGYRVAGRYSYESPGRYPVLDVESARIHGQDTASVQLASTGHEVFVTSAGTTRKLSDAEATPLLLGDGAESFGDLGFAGWMRDGAATERADGSQVVTGRVDAADLLSDLTRVMGQVAGAPVPRLDETAAQQLEDLVQSSRMRVVLDEGGTPRELSAAVRFEAAGSRRLRQALGELAAARLVVDVDYTPLRALTVTPPGG